MNILTLDIETSPHVVYDFQLWGDRYTPPARLIQPTKILCICAKWVGQRGVMKIHGDQEYIARRIYNMLLVADAVVTFNGKVFDVPHINSLLLEFGLVPPPYVHIDLRAIAKRTFKFPYTSLDQICKTLGLGKKGKSPGMEIFIACMKGDAEAMQKMLKYCAQDVRITEKLYLRLLPWIQVHPNAALIDELGDLACVRCGSKQLRRQGYRHTTTRSYARYQCRDCGKWNKGTRSMDAVRMTSA